VSDQLLRELAEAGRAETDEDERWATMMAVYRAAAGRPGIVGLNDRFAPRRYVFAGLERPPTLLLGGAAAWWYGQNGDEETLTDIAQAVVDVATWWP
jgi:hypothetical protein